MHNVRMIAHIFPPIIPTQDPLANAGAKRLMQVSMNSLDYDDFSNATPLSATQSAAHSALQLTADGKVTDLSVALESQSQHEARDDISAKPEPPKPQQSKRSVLESLGGSLHELKITVPETYRTKESSGRKVSQQPSMPKYSVGSGYSYSPEHELVPMPSDVSPRSEPRKRRRCSGFVYDHRYLIIFACVVVGVVAFLSVHLTKRNGGTGSDTSVSSASGRDPVPQSDVATGIPLTPEEIERRDGIKAILAEAGISDAAVLDDPSSPQYYALEWISFVDGAILDPYNRYLPSRYALAVFYLSATLAEDVRDNGNIFRSRDATGNHTHDGIVGWNDSSNWMSSKGYCSWAGIECVPLEGSQKSTYDSDYVITNINMTSNNIRGSIPTELAAAFGESLQVLDLSNNRLDSTIPRQLNNAKSLEVLSLSGNMLTGEIPDVSNLQQLRVLNLGENELSSSIPQSIGDLTSVTELCLGSNKLTGTLPSIEKLESMEKIELQENSLTGEIGWLSFHRMAYVKEIRLQNNNFAGVLPYQMGFLGYLSKLEVLDLSSNSISGTLPRAIKNVKGLRELLLFDNKMDGELPDTLGDLWVLERLHLQGNNIKGTVPDSVCELKGNYALQELITDCSGRNPKVNCRCCTACGAS